MAEQIKSEKTYKNWFRFPTKNSKSSNIELEQIKVQDRGAKKRLNGGFKEGGLVSISETASVEQNNVCVAKFGREEYKITFDESYCKHSGSRASSVDAEAIRPEDIITQTNHDFNDDQYNEFLQE